MLVVEDNDVNQMVLSELLIQAGYRCAIAAGGREALELIKREPFDLVLMDCQMPDMDGYEAAERIRGTEATAEPRRRTTILALTANATPENRARCLASGMDDFLSKPIDPPKFYETLAKHLGVGASVAAVPEDECRGASTAVESRAEPPLRVDDLVARCGGNRDAAARALRRFIERMPAELVELGEALRAGEGERASRLAHRMKGAAAVIAAESLRRSFEELEKAGAAAGAGAADGTVAHAETALASALAEFARVAECAESPICQIL